MNDIFDEPEVKSIDDYFGALKDSLRTKLSAGKPSIPSVWVHSDYIRLALKDLRQLILKHDDKGTLIWNATVIHFDILSKHMTAGVYKVWLKAGVGYRTYAQGLGQPYCSWEGYSQCQSLAEGGLFCKSHTGLLCSVCGNAAVKSCTHGEYYGICDKKLCSNCKCTH